MRSRGDGADAGSFERTLCSVVDALPDLVTVFRADGSLLFVNRRHREYLGDSSDTDGRDLDHAQREVLAARDIHPDDLPVYLEGRATMSGGQPGSFEVRLRRADGTYRWHRVATRAARDEDGAVRFWLVTSVDIEDDRRTTQDLDAARRQSAETAAVLSTLLEGAPVGFAFMDRDYRFVHINEQLAAINGRSVREHLGKHVADVIPELWSQIEPLYRRVLAGETLTDIEIVGEVPSAPGVRRYWLGSYYPVRPDGVHTEGIGIVVREVTGERQLAERLTQAQKMQAVGQLAGGVAHDFNNVLATVTLTAELLARTDDPTLLAGLQRILASARSATELTKKLLLFARQQPTNAVAVDVAPAVERVLHILSGTLASSVSVDVDVTGCPPVLIDPTHLEQVLLNLLINARDAMPQGGRLSVLAAEVDGGARSGGSDVGERMVALTVTDTGVGMTPEVRARALEPFFSTKSAGLGTGLGLSTVDGIVSSAGGRVAIDSEAGRGTSVRVELPVADARRAATDRPIAQAAEARGQRILVVEDQDDLRAVVAEILTAAGYAVMPAATGVDATALMVENGGFDLVVSDVVMPGMTGPELVHELAEMAPRGPVVFMSGYTGGVLEAHGLPPDAVVLSKPFTSETLLAAVSEALGDR